MFYIPTPPVQKEDFIMGDEVFKFPVDLDDLFTLFYSPSDIYTMDDENQHKQGDQ